MIIRDHDVIAYNLRHKLIFKYNWTQKDEQELQELKQLLETENPHDYPNNRIQPFVDVLGNVTFIERYFPDRKIEE